MKLIIHLEHPDTRKFAERYVDHLQMGVTVLPLTDLELIDEVILVLQERGADVAFVRAGNAHSLSLEQARRLRSERGLDIR